MENKVKTLKVSTSEIGENFGYDRNSLKGFKAEKTIKRILSENVDAVSEHLFTKHKINHDVQVRLFEEDNEREKRLKYQLPEPYEYFTSVELLKDNVTDLSSRFCLEAIDIHNKEGILKMVDYLVEKAPIAVTQ
jgi:hypothetical protein